MSRYGQYNSFDAAVVDIAETLTDLITIPCAEMENLCVEVTPTDEAFDQFAIQGKFHKSGAFNTLFSAAADFTSPSGVLLGASGNLTALADGTTGWFIIHVKGIYQIRIQAASASGTLADVQTYAGGN